MLSADFELLKERVLNQVADKKEGTEDVLRAEIKADSIQGTDVESKKEKLAEMRQRKTVQVETIEQDRKETLAQPKDGMKVVIK